MKRKIAKLDIYIQQLQTRLQNKGTSINVKDSDRFAYCANLLAVNGRQSKHANAIWDTGATHHLHWHIGVFTNKHTPVVTSVRGVGSQRMKVSAAGTVNGLHGVLHMPACTQPIISVGAFLDQVGGTLSFSGASCYPSLDGQQILVAKRDEKGLYRTAMTPQEALGITKGTADIHLSTHAQVLRERIHMLHRCLGHVGRERMLQVLKRNNFTNLKTSDLELLTSCDACHSGKIRKANRPKRASRRPTDFGHTITSDSTSKQKIRTRGGKLYANVAVDEATRWSWVKLLAKVKHTHDDAIEPLLTSNALHKLVKILRTDLGSEFRNEPTKRTCI
jgi:hypothetical protein